MIPSPRLTLALALLLDLTLGDPPNRVHPVAWMGQGIAALERRAPRRGTLPRLLYGGLLAIGGAAAVAAAGRFLEKGLSRLPYPARRLWSALLLKSTFSLRDLFRAALSIERALAEDNLPEARALLAWHLVSRDTSTLAPALVAAATIESLAENLSDSVVAPLLYFTAGGNPCALLYRFLNTSDAMLGYRDPEHEWLGKLPARLDDLANFLPARLAAHLLLLAAWLAGEDACNGLKVYFRDRRLTASPNAGHPMAAMAGALRVELEKEGHYRLGTGRPPPAPRDIRRALRLNGVAVALLTGLLLTHRRPTREDL